MFGPSCLCKAVPRHLNRQELHLKLRKLTKSSCRLNVKSEKVDEKGYKPTTAQISGLDDIVTGFSAKNGGEKTKIPLTAYILLIVPGATLSLGIWQIQRRKWKLNLIENMEKKLYNDPVRLPEVTSDLEGMEYTPIEVVGEFDHSREFVIHPRTRNETTSAPIRSRGIPILGDGSGHGGHVVTPFRLADRDIEILVNRGWVARAQLDPETRKEGQIPGLIKLVGILRQTEKRPLMVNNNVPEKNEWFYRDVEAMANHVGTAPIYLEASYKSSVPNGPLGGQTIVNIRNQHWEYIITWFSISAITTYLWYMRFMK